MDSRVNAIEFNREKHEYWFTDEQGHHRRLYGITGVIGKMLNKTYPVNSTNVQTGILYGNTVHSESELWIKENKEPSTEAGKWLVQYLKDMKSKYNVSHFDAELLVSDFEKTASCIDIVAHLPDKKAILFDIKTTSHFDRAYCSLQLSCYQRLFENVYDEKVEAMYVLATKSKRAFKILKQDPCRVQKIFDMNKER